MHTSIKFELHDKLDRYYVSVIDKNTDEVIKEIPPKKMLDMYAAMAEFMGFIVDEKVQEGVLMINNTMRVSGLASGMDTDQIIADLMKAERIPMTKMQPRSGMADVAARCLS